MNSGVSYFEHYVLDNDVTLYGKGVSAPVSPD